MRQTVATDFILVGVIMSGKLIDFYSDFEGEGEVRIYGTDTLSIWDGYFDPIMAVMLEIEVSYRGAAFGIVADFHTCAGWSSIQGGKHKVLNINEEIHAFSQFDCKKLDNTEYSKIDNEWKQKIINVHTAILELLSDAQKNNLDVFIEDC